MTRRPTVLDLFGLDQATHMESMSLVPAAFGAALPSERVVFMASTQYPTYAAVRRDHKLIINQGTSALEYYDLALDPSESFNLADTDVVDDWDVYCPLVNWMVGRF